MNDIGPVIQAEDERTVTLQLPNGNSVVVAKTPGNAGMLEPMRSKPYVPNAVDPNQDVWQFKPLNRGEVNKALPVQPQPVAAVAEEVPREVTASAVPQTPSLQEVGTRMIGEGFAKQQKALTDQTKAVDEGVKEGTRLAAEKIAQIDAFQRAEEKAVHDERENHAVRAAAYDKKMSELEEAKQKYRNFTIDPNRLFKKSETWQKALAGIAILLGGIGAGYTKNKENQGLKAINNAIDRDIHAQELEQQKLGQAYEDVNGELSQIRHQFDDDKERFVFEKQIRLDALSKYLARIEASSQGSEYAQKAGALRATLEAASGQLQQKQGEMYLQSLPNTKDVKPEQWKAAGFVQRMRQAEEVISKLKSKGFTGSEFKAGNFSPLERFKGDDIKSLDSAKRAFVSAVLRKESGAAISATEYEDADKKYFPQAGDSTGVITQKERLRQQDLNSIAAEAGPALKLIPYVPAYQTPVGFKPLK